MAKLELNLTNHDVETIVLEWVRNKYPSLAVESISTLTGMEFDGSVGYNGETIPKFKGFNVQVNQKEEKL